jgi:hypothetical protein
MENALFAEECARIALFPMYPLSLYMHQGILLWQSKVGSPQRQWMLNRLSRRHAPWTRGALAGCERVVRVA